MINLHSFPKKLKLNTYRCSHDDQSEDNKLAGSALPFCIVVLFPLQYEYTTSIKMQSVSLTLVSAALSLVFSRSRP